MLSHNDTRAKDLVPYLKKMQVRACEVCVGDYVVEDYCTFYVAKITTRPTDEKFNTPMWKGVTEAILLADEQDNGSWTPPDYQVTILNRSIIEP